MIEMPAHYLGYLVLQTNDKKNFLIIDGQQRITTLCLIVLAATYNLQELVERKIDPENNSIRIDTLRDSFIGFRDSVTLLRRSKLKLNRSNDDYYQHNIVEYKKTLPKRGFSATEHSLRKAFEFFCKKIEIHIQNATNKGVAIAEFIEAMSLRFLLHGHDRR